MIYELYTTDGNLNPVSRESLSRVAALDLIRQMLFDVSCGRTVAADDRGRGWRVWWLPSGYLCLGTR